MVADLLTGFLPLGWLQFMEWTERQPWIRKIDDNN